MKSSVLLGKKRKSSLNWIDASTNQKKIKEKKKMLPVFIGLAVAGIAFIESQSTDAKIEREVEKFQKGKQSKQEAQKNIDSHIVAVYELDDYLSGDTESNLE